MELGSDDAFFKSTLMEVDRRVRNIKERGFKTSSKKNKAIFKLHSHLHTMVAIDAKAQRIKECGGETKEWDDYDTKECKPVAKKQNVCFDGIPWEKIEQCHTLIGEEEQEIKEDLYSPPVRMPRSLPGTSLSYVKVPSMEVPALPRIISFREVSSCMEPGALIPQPRN
jgi:hypothetical protein